MRTFVARSLAVALGCAILALAAAFAQRQNPASPSDGAPAPAAVWAEPPPLTRADSMLIPVGRTLVTELGCLRCHGVGGVGNPRSPLDDVGRRRSRDEIRAWVLAGPSVRRTLPGSAVRAKAPNSELPADDLAVLIIFLSSLRGERGS